MRTLDEQVARKRLTGSNYVYILLIMSERTQHDRIEHLARTCACINMRRAARAVTNYYDGLLLEACGLRMTQITPLVVLYLAGPQTIHEIAGKLGLDRTTLTRNLKLLEQAGLPKMDPAPAPRNRPPRLTPPRKKRVVQDPPGCGYSPTAG